MDEATAAAEVSVWKPKGFLAESGCTDSFRSYVCDDLIMGNEERRGAKYVTVLKDQL